MKSARSPQTDQFVDFRQPETRPLHFPLPWHFFPTPHRIVSTRLEPVTHFLTGACMGRAGLNRKTALATLTLTLAAEAPDLDVLGRFRGSAFGFAHHRGFTHSFLGIVLVAALVVGFVYLVWLIRGRKLKDPNLPPRWGILFLYACLAGLSHILLDFTNNYGVRPFWPFSEKWYSWDIVFIFEPIMFGLLLLGLITPSLLRSDRQRNRRAAAWSARRIAASVALIAVVLLWAVRDYEHRRALNALAARTYEGADPARVSAYPSFSDPFHWYGVVETSGFFVLAPVDSLRPRSQSRSCRGRQARYPLQAGRDAHHPRRQALLPRTRLSRLGAVSHH
jgi:inner membrane protein